MWSLSYVFATTATAFALMAIVYAVVDVADWWSGAPFYQAGELKWTWLVSLNTGCLSRM